MDRKRQTPNISPLLAFVGGGTMAAGSGVFHFDDDRPSFESFANANGFRYWLASDLKDHLGYQTMAPVLRAVNRAMAACAAADIGIADNFLETTTEGVGRDWKLSRFACYLTVMNGDPRNASVAQAQAYFITMAEAFKHYVQHTDGVDRVLIRGELADRERTLSQTAKLHGIENYPFFQNAGYRGMYNMDLAQLRARKRIPQDRSPLDFMNKTELAANLFRVTQTEEKIIAENVRGQTALERTHRQVGQKVRDTMYELSGTRPEHLPPAPDIKEVRKGLKQSQKEYGKLDAAPARRKKRPPRD